MPGTKQRCLPDTIVTRLSTQRDDVWGGGLLYDTVQLHQHDGPLSKSILTARRTALHREQGGHKAAIEIQTQTAKSAWTNSLRYASGESFTGIDWNLFVTIMARFRWLWLTFSYRSNYLECYPSVQQTTLTGGISLLAGNIGILNTINPHKKRSD